MTCYRYVPPLAPIRPEAKKGMRIHGNPRHAATVRDGYPAQDLVIAYIEERLLVGNVPTREDIRAHMRWNRVGSVDQILKRMAGRGVIPKGFPYP